MQATMEPTHVPSQVDLLHRISGIVSSERSLDEMLGEVVGLTVQVTGCDACLVYLIDKESNEIVLRASQVPHAAELGTLRMQMGEGVTGWVAEHKSVVALGSNAGADRRFKRFSDLVEDTYEAFLSVPLVSGGEVIGVINVHHREEHQHTPEELSLCTFVGEQMGNAVARARLAQANARLMEETTSFDLNAPEQKPRGNWTDYVWGVAVVLENAGCRLRGADLLIDGDVPLGAGLSSSAAIEVATGYALLSNSGLPIDLTQLALTCQRAENEFVGMRCGIMDQFAAYRNGQVAAGRAGDAYAPQEPDARQASRPVRPRSRRG